MFNSPGCSNILKLKQLRKLGIFLDEDNRSHRVPEDIVGIFIEPYGLPLDATHPGHQEGN